MTHAFTRTSAVVALGLVVLTAAPAAAQRGVPAARAASADSGRAPMKEAIVPPAAPVPLAAAQRTPVPSEPLRPLDRTQPPSQASRAVVVDTSVAPPAPTPIERQPPPAARALASPATAARSVSVSNVVPAGSTGRCKDGTYINGTASDAACTDRGGLAFAFPAARVAPAQTRP